MVATKMGRRVAQEPSNYTLSNFRAWTDRSRANLGVDRLDLVQLHLPAPPPSTVPTRSTTRWTRWSPRSGSPPTGSAWRRAKRRWPRSRGRGWPPCRSSSTRSSTGKPLDQVLPAAAAAGVGIIVRVPFGVRFAGRRGTRWTPRSARTTTGPTTGTARFNVGETSPGWISRPACRPPPEFAAIVAGAGRLHRRPHLVADQRPGGAARWATQQPGVTTVIPGARNTEQARHNAAADPSAAERARAGRDRTVRQVLPR